jgi:hypothetical protein
LKNRIAAQSAAILLKKSATNPTVANKNRSSLFVVGVTPEQSKMSFECLEYLLYISPQMLADMCSELPTLLLKNCPDYLYFAET